MKIFILVFSLSLLFSCKSSSVREEHLPLTPNEFIAKMNQLPGGVLVDVRTQEEYEKGFIPGAVNADWNSSEQFEEITSKISTDTPVFLYCLGGGRSESAAEYLRNKGYTEVYDLKDGFQGWMAARLPVDVPKDIKTKSKPKSMTMDEYQSLISSRPAVLVDFYADWCGPCKMMKPHLEEIAESHKDKIEIVKINADHNRELCLEVGVRGLPTLVLYEEGKETWRNIGYLNKSGILEAIQ